MKELKRNLLVLLSLFILPGFQSLEAQSEWRSNTGATVNDENTMIKRSGAVGLGVNAQATRQLSVQLSSASNNTYGIFSQASKPIALSDRVRAIYGEITSGQGYAIGLEGKSYTTTASSAGRAYGVYATAGNASSRANYGVFSMLTGSRTGAAVVGWDQRNNAWWNELIDAGSDFAGYFVGNLKVVGDQNLNLSVGRSNSARLEIGLASCVGCFSPAAQTDDVVLRKMGPGKMMIFDTGAGANLGEGFLFTTSGSTIMKLMDNGKVSIGTGNAPTSIGGENIGAYSLFVEGGILTDECRVETGWADYVFDAGYRLMPLAEVAEFVQENGHLPNTPSAAQIREAGLELGQATTLQQEKIEEIFLHLIRMEQQIEALQTENAQLKASLDKQK